MPTEILRVDPQAPDPGPIARAGAVLRRGGLVAFPTETVYGLGANALDPRAVAGIFAAKGRPPTNPVIVHIAAISQARALAGHWPEAADRLAQAFWPGPLTLVVSATQAVPRVVTAGLPKVGIRMPAHPVALALLREAGVPIAAPSANRSNELSPTTADHVASSLGERIEMILDGGPTMVGIESTVVDLTGAVPVILRPGGVSRSALEAVLGPVGTSATAVPEEHARAGPGMMARHYAPRARLLVLPTGEVEAAVRREAGAGLRCGALVRKASPGVATASITLPRDPAGAARELYAALHRLDAECEVIVAEEPPEGPEWDAIRDRLARASHPG